MYNRILKSTDAVVDDNIIPPTFEDETINDDYAFNKWNSMGSSIDGDKIVAATYYGHVYVTDDYGVSWTLRLVVDVDDNNPFIKVTIDKTGDTIMCTYGKISTSVRIMEEIGRCSH